MELFCENCRSPILLPDDIEDERVECPTCGQTILILAQSPSPEVHRLTTSWGQSANREAADKDICTTVTRDLDAQDTRLSPKALYKHREIVCPSCGGTVLEDDYILKCSKCEQEWCDVTKRNRKEFSKAQSKSIKHAPDRTCPYCDWSGKDWGFKYHRSCTFCYNRWRKQKAEARSRLKPPNENIEVTSGIVVTRNVRERLEKQAESDVPRGRKWESASRWDNYVPLISLAGCALSVWLFFRSTSFWVIAVVITTLALSWAVQRAADRTMVAERLKRSPKVQSRLEQLARERQHRIDETNAFYASAEWRLIRQKVIEEQGQLCKGQRCSRCGRKITDEFDLTVDHIKPRSKFPELALELSNLQVLCRSCNSAKSDTTENDLEALE